MNVVALLLGVFLVPLTMLAACHRFRRLSRRERRTLWGFIIGYAVALIVVLIALMAPPMIWTPEHPIRSLIVHWGLLVIPGLGAAFASLRWRSI
ncbi:MAG: hypothetical protein NWP69_13705 [Congregibacter sp.]|nr:hypothetical protein [Congregibacter sp.]